MISLQDNHWTQNYISISAGASVFGLVIGTVRWTLIQKSENHDHWIYFLNCLRLWDPVQSKPWTGFDLSLIVKVLSFSQIIFLWCRRSLCPLRTELNIIEISFFYEKCGTPSSNVEINHILCRWHWGPDYFHDLMEIDPHISQSCVLSTESTEAQPISTQTV
jgi:hypothetical protein